MQHTTSDDRLPTGFAALTASKVVLTTAQRWVPALLPTLTAAFGTSTTTMTSLMGIGQLGGTVTFFTGQWLTERTERRFIRIGIAIVALSSALALGGVTAAFGASFLLLVIGHTHATVASHAWVGHRVRFSQRGRAIGLFEVSWSLGLLLGTPILAAAVYLWGWRAGYVALLVGCAAAFALITVRLPASASPADTEASSARLGRPPDALNETRAPKSDAGRAVVDAVLADGDPPSRSVRSLPLAAWPPILASAFAALTGIGFFAIASTWLHDTHGLGTRSLGAIAFGYGAVELIASSTVAAISDRLGTRRSMLLGLVALFAVIAALGFVGTSLLLTIVGLLAFLLTFEFAFVSSLALVTEAAPNQRGTAIGVSNAVGTVGRGSGVAIAGATYAWLGIAGPLWMSAVATVISIGFLLMDRSLGLTGPDTNS